MTIFNAYKNQTSGEITCLPDRFNWFAFLVPPVWAIAHRLWRELLLIILGVVVLALAAGYFELPFTALYLVGALWLGFEAHHVHGRALLRRGWRAAGTLNAADRIDAETEADRRQFGQA